MTHKVLILLCCFLCAAFSKHLHKKTIFFLLGASTHFLPLFCAHAFFAFLKGYQKFLIKTNDILSNKVFFLGEGTAQCGVLNAEKW